jgi:hypothetical protein
MARLEHALAAVSEGLEAALQAAVPRLGAPHVVLGNPAEASAKHGESSQGRFMVTLTGLHLGAGRGAPPSNPTASGRQPAAALEADLLLTADFPGQYVKGIRMMAAALDWLHDHPVLTAREADAADEGRFTVEFVDPGFEEAAALVDMAGVKGCPFALLRLRGLSAGGHAGG